MGSEGVLVVLSVYPSVAALVVEIRPSARPGQVPVVVVEDMLPWPGRAARGL